LAVSALLLAVSTLAKQGELLRHLLDRASEIGQLPGDARYVLIGCHGLPGFYALTFGFIETRAGGVKRNRIIGLALRPQAETLKAVNAC
jgi:hypothetical protein